MKKITLKVIMALAVSYGTVCFGLDAADNSGTTAGEFLRIEVGARAEGMGGAFSPLADDVNAVYWNPAGLAGVTTQQILLSHTFWFADIYHEYVAYVHPLGGDNGAIGASFTYLFTSFEKRAADTDTVDSLGTVGEYAVNLSYGRNILMPGLKLGVAAKYVGSSLDTVSASSFAFDAGLQYALMNNVILSATYSNFLGSLNYGSTAFNIGNTFDAGVGLREFLMKDLNLAVDLRTPSDFATIQINAGAEYKIKCSQDIVITPRAGFKVYNSQITGGFGINYQQYQIDYAFQSNSDLGLSHRISLAYNFGAPAAATPVPAAIPADTKKEEVKPVEQPK